jgi:hypothetical protein
LDAALEQSMAKRIRPHRGFASVCGDERDARQITELANKLGAAESQCRSFNFNHRGKSKAR